MPVTVLPRGPSGPEQFIKGLNLDKMADAFIAALERRYEREKEAKVEERAVTKEKREVAKEAREEELAIRKGEIAIPEQYRGIRRPSLDVTGLPTKFPPPTAETIARARALPLGTEAIGPPEFMRRFAPAEAPQVAQQRMMAEYAAQQQAISPYKALAGEKITARDEIERLTATGVAWKDIPVRLKMIAGFAGKETQKKSDWQKMEEIFGEEPSPSKVPEYNPKTHKLQQNTETGEYRVIAK